MSTNTVRADIGGEEIIRVYQYNYSNSVAAQEMKEELLSIYNDIFEVNTAAYLIDTSEGNRYAVYNLAPDSELWDFYEVINI